ncbi:hypothetical protein ES703_85702 [subsurface metagenome]
MGLVGDMFERFLSRQSLFLESLSKDAKKKLAEVENKYATLRVTGPEGGIFYFQFKGQRLHILEEPPDIPYEKLDKFLLDGDLFNYSGGDEVLFDVIDRSLSPRAVIARKYFRAHTDKIIYDTEEFAQAFERFLDDMQVVLRRRR